MTTSPSDLWWRPQAEEKDLGITTPGFERAMESVFGEYPISLTNEHLPVLKAMSAAGGASYGKVVKLLVEFGPITIGKWQ